MGRLLVAGVVGGVIMFLWGAVSHMVLDIGTAGLGVLTDEAPVEAALKSTAPAAGVYVLPGMDPDAELSEEEQAAWGERFKAGPTAFIVYRPDGSDPWSPRLFLIELLSDVLAALVGAWILGFVTAGYGARVLVAVGLGLVGWLSLSISYWNWYRFPDAFVLAEGIDQVVGWLLSGLALAAIVRTPRPGPAGA